LELGMAADVCFEDFSLPDDFGRNRIERPAANPKDSFFMNKCFICPGNRNILPLLFATEGAEFFRRRFTLMTTDFKIIL